MRKLRPTHRKINLNNSAGSQIYILDVFLAIIVFWSQKTEEGGCAYECVLHTWVGVWMRAYTGRCTLCCMTDALLKNWMNPFIFKNGIWKFKCPEGGKMICYLKENCGTILNVKWWLLFSPFLKPTSSSHNLHTKKYISFKCMAWCCWQRYIFM